MNLSLPPLIFAHPIQIGSSAQTKGSYRSRATSVSLSFRNPDHLMPDPATNAPELCLRSCGGQVEVVWNKCMMEAVEIQKDSGTCWQAHAVDTRPNYTDTTSFPSPPLRRLELPRHLHRRLPVQLSVEQCRGNIRGRVEVMTSQIFF